jgi:competence protein ComEC
MAEWIQAFGQRKRWRTALQAVNGRPLASFCGSYLAGAAAGVTFSMLSVLQGCLLCTVTAWFLWRYRMLSTAVAFFIAAGVWLGATQGIHSARQDDLLWRSLPCNEVVVAEGTVLTEPVKKAGAWRFVFRTQNMVTPQGVLRTPVQLWVYLPEARIDNVFAGERLRLEGRLRTPSATPGDPEGSFARYLRRQGVSRTLRPYRVERLPQARWTILFSRWRRTLICHLRSHLPTREGHIAAAIVLNDRTGLDDAIRESFRRTGTVHILSPSGTHVSMLAVAVWAICRFLRLPRRISALAVMTVIWLFAGVAAGGEPAFRAAVMGTLVAGAVALQRELDPLTSLALAGFLLVCAEPGTLRDPSFQFSFTLVTAIIASSGWLGAIAFRATDDRITLFRGLFASLLLSGVCTVASAPLTALYYGQMSLIAPVANLVIAAPVQLLTSAGLAAACLPQLPDLLSAPIAASAWSVDRAVRWLATPPWASVDVSAPLRWHIILFYTLLFTVLLTLSARANRRRRGWTW